MSKKIEILFLCTFYATPKTETTMKSEMTLNETCIGCETGADSIHAHTHACNHTHVCKHTTKIIYTDDSEEEDDDYCIGCETGADSISAHTDACNRANGFA